MAHTCTDCESAAAEHRAVKTQFRTRTSPAGNLLVDRRNKITGEWRFNGYMRAKLVADILVRIDLAEWVVD
jgi:hypothetical protein